MTSSKAVSVELVRRFRQKFEVLEESCMERFQSREVKVNDMMKTAVMTLQQLQNWAAYGVSPQDELHGSKYIHFVDFKYQCSIEPLRKLYDNLSASDPGSISDRDLLEAVKSEGDPDLTASSSSMSDSPRSLKDKLDYISKKYLEEGTVTRDIIAKSLNKYRKDIRTMYRWGQASVLDLHDILDESMADELYCMVRAKMNRILATLGSLEDICDQVMSKDERQSPFNESSPRSQSSMEVRETKTKQKEPERQIPPRRLERLEKTELLDSTKSTDSGRSTFHDSGRFSDDMNATSASSLRLQDELSLALNTSRSDPSSTTGYLETPRGAGGLCGPGEDLQRGPAGDILLPKNFAMDLSPRPQHLLEQRRRERGPRSYALDLNKSVGKDTALDLGASRGSNTSDQTDSRESSPEPPVSPRPKGLANHPKIIKDKLHNYSLPSRFNRSSSNW